MPTPTEKTFMAAAEAMKTELRDRRRTVMRHSTEFLGAINEADGDMAELLKRDRVTTIKALAAPLIGESMYGRTQAVSYYLSHLSKPGEPTANVDRDMPFAGVFAGVETIHEENLTSLCLVVDAYKEGRNGDYPYMNPSRICKRTRYIEPVVGRLWVPIAPTTHLRVNVNHYDDAISRTTEAIHEIFDTYAIFAEPGPWNGQPRRQNERRVM